MTIFQGMRCRTTKMNITFSMRNGVSNMALKFFSQKPPHIGWMKAKKPVLGAHFPSYQWFYWNNCFQKNRVHPFVDWHKPCEFHENRVKTTTCIMTLIIISWKSRSVIFWRKLKNIHQVSLLESILIQKKILWRINFVFIKFLLNALLFEKSCNECKNPSFLHKATCIESVIIENAALLFYIHGFIF